MHDENILLFQYQTPIPPKKCGFYESKRSEKYMQNLEITPVALIDGLYTSCIT